MKMKIMERNNIYYQINKIYIFQIKLKVAYKEFIKILKKINKN